MISSSEHSDIFAGFSPLETEIISIKDGLGRVPADGDMRAGEQLPSFSRATMDGFALRVKDSFGCSETEPVLLEIIGEIIMGSSGTVYTLQAGQAVRIWTGGELPVNGDGVVMIERTRLIDDTTVEVFRPVAPGENIIRAGEDFEVDTMIFPGGRKKLRPQELGVLAGLGTAKLRVHKQVKVGIISTGDELISPDTSLEPGKVRDINATTLAALVVEAGAVPTCYGIVEDNIEQMLTVCEQALAENDMLLLSGGSSAGKRDFTLKVLENISGCELLACAATVKPGKPTLLARRNNQAVFGLPGHAASAMVVFYLFVRPLIHRFSGLSPEIGLKQTVAMTAQQIPSTIGREEFVRVSLAWNKKKKNEPPLATPVYGKPGLLRALIRADGLLVIDRDTERIDAGAMARVLLFP